MVGNVRLQLLLLLEDRVLFEAVEAVGSGHEERDDLVGELGHVGIRVRLHFDEQVPHLVEEEVDGLVGVGEEGGDWGAGVGGGDARASVGEGEGRERRGENGMGAGCC